MTTTDTDTVELWSPITDEGMSMTPGELIVEFMDLVSDRNSQTGNPYLYGCRCRAWSSSTGDGAG